MTIRATTTRAPPRWNTMIMPGLILYLLLKDLTMMTPVLMVDNVKLNNGQLSQPSESTTEASWNYKENPLSIPQGRARNLPSIRIEDTSITSKRGHYGGKGDKVHLGGFTEMDGGGISPGLFKKMITDMGVRSFLDIGCGRGFSTSWFHFHGVDVLCAEGSHDAYERSVLPDPEHQVVEHDFSRGPWWPEKTYDVAWSVEFLEHVSRQYHFNYIAAYRKAAIIMVTSSPGDGWHHVEAHGNEWWIQKYESYGFRYNDELSQKVRTWAKETKDDYKGPMNNNELNGFYIFRNMKVFVNPTVAALPEHAHLFPELGCGSTAPDGRSWIRRACESPKETPLPENMQALKITDEMDTAWFDWVKKHVQTN